MSSHSKSSQGGEDSARRGRTLYSDADSARRNIMRIHDDVKDSNLAANINRRDGESFNLNPLLSKTELQRLEGGLEGDGGEKPATPSTKYLGYAETPKLNRSSSVYPHSNFSDPFDLDKPSDGGDDIEMRNIDQVVATDHNARYGNNHEQTQGAALPGDSGTFAVYDEGADSHADASQHESDTEYSQFFNQYDYTRGSQITHDSNGAFLGGGASPQSSVEFGRAVTLDSASHGLSSKVSEHGSISRQSSSVDGNTTCEAHGKVPPDPSAPPTSQPPGIGSDKFKPQLYYLDCNDLPSSTQTYGDTRQLLQITTQEPDIFTAHMNAHNGFQDAENLSPDTIGLALSPPDIPNHRGFRQMWSSSEGVARRRGDASDRGLSGQPMARLSSVDPDNESAWETDVADSYQDRVDHGGRPSDESYADTSVYDAESQRFSFPGSQARQLGRFQVGVKRLKSKTKPYHLLGKNNDNAERAAKLDRARVIITRKIKLMKSAMSNEFLTADADTNDRVTHRGDEEWLEMLRQEDPEGVRQVTDECYETWLDRPQSMNSFDQVVEESRRLEAIESLSPTPDCNRKASGKSKYFGLTYDRPKSSNKFALARAKPVTPTPATNNRSPSPFGGLEFSHSDNTFRTMRYGAPAVPGIRLGRVKEYSPLSPTLPAVAMTPASRIASVSSQQTPAPGDAELLDYSPLVRMVARSRRALSSQTSPLPFRISAAPECGPLSDRGLMAAERTWSMVPDFSHDGPLGLHADRTRRPRSESFTMLIRREDRNQEVVKIQKKFSFRYFVVFSLCPVTAIVFGFGGFDGLMRRHTAGRATKMRDDDKRLALWVSAPLSAIVWTLAALILALFLTFKRF